MRDFLEMSRRKLLSMIIIGSSTAVIGCDDQANHETAFVKAAQHLIEEIKGVLNKLELDAGEFKTQDWRDFLPVVLSDIGNLRTTVEDLEKFLEDPAPDVVY